MQFTTPYVLEAVRFQLKPDQSADEFLDLARQGQTVLAALPGFRRRSLAEDAGQWLDLIEWDSLQAAQAAVPIVMAHPDFAGFMAAIDEASVEMRHMGLQLTMTAKA
jgi:hypothetical protein